MHGLLFEFPLAAAAPDFDALARAVIPGEASPMIGRLPSLDDHLARLRREFAGASQLDFYHAVLNVLIRRNLDSDIAYTHFKALWREQHVHLLQSLSARWLVSACDTIMDRANDPAERARACIGSMLMNCIKLYETERLAMSESTARLADLSDPQPLFDGMTSFSVGHGDMIFNLRARTNAVCAGETTAGRIVLELLRRADREDTIFRRLADAHTDDATRWA